MKNSEEFPEESNLIGLEIKSFAEKSSFKGEVLSSLKQKRNKCPNENESFEDESEKKSKRLCKIMETNSEDSKDYKGQKKMTYFLENEDLHIPKFENKNSNTNFETERNCETNNISKNENIKEISLKTPTLLIPYAYNDPFNDFNNLLNSFILNQEENYKNIPSINNREEEESSFISTNLSIERNCLNYETRGALSIEEYLEDPLFDQYNFRENPAKSDFKKKEIFSYFDNIERFNSSDFSLEESEDKISNKNGVREDLSDQSKHTEGVDEYECIASSSKSKLSDLPSKDTKEKFFFNFFSSEKETNYPLNNFHQNLLKADILIERNKEKANSKTKETDILENKILLSIEQSDNSINDIGSYQPDNKTFFNPTDGYILEDDLENVVNDFKEDEMFTYFNLSMNNIEKCNSSDFSSEESRHEIDGVDCIREDLRDQSKQAEGPEEYDCIANSIMSKPPDLPSKNTEKRKVTDLSAIKIFNSKIDISYPTNIFHQGIFKEDISIERNNEKANSRTNETDILENRTILPLKQSDNLVSNVDSFIGDSRKNFNCQSLFSQLDNEEIFNFTKNTITGDDLENFDGDFKEDEMFTYFNFSMNKIEMSNSFDFFLKESEDKIGDKDCIREDLSNQSKYAEGVDENECIASSSKPKPVDLSSRDSKEGNITDVSTSGFVSTEKDINHSMKNFHHTLFKEDVLITRNKEKAYSETSEMDILENRTSLSFKQSDISIRDVSSSIEDSKEYFNYQNISSRLNNEKIFNNYLIGDDLENVTDDFKEAEIFSYFNLSMNNIEKSNSSDFSLEESKDEIDSVDCIREDLRDQSKQVESIEEYECIASSSKSKPPDLTSSDTKERQTTDRSIIEFCNSEKDINDSVNNFHQSSFKNGIFIENNNEKAHHGTSGTDSLEDKTDLSREQTDNSVRDLGFPIEDSREDINYQNITFQPDNEEIFNATNNSIIGDDLENITDDLLARIDDRINIEGEEDDTSLRVLFSDLEQEFFDMINDVTLIESSNQNLFEAQEEIITILNDMKAEKNEEEVDEEINTNKSNSLLSSVILVGSNEEKDIPVDMDEIMYYLTVTLEIEEGNFYQKSLCPNFFRMNNTDSFGNYFFENLLLKKGRTEMIFTDRCKRSIFKFEMVNFKEFCISPKVFFYHLFIERLFFTSKIDTGFLILREICLLSLKDYIDFFFNINNQELIKDTFNEKDNVLDFINNIFSEQEKNVVYTNISKQICIDILSAVEYIHKKTFLLRNISTSDIGITLEGFIKIGMLNSKNKYLTSTEDENEQFSAREEFTSDYLYLGLLLTEIFIPGLNLTDEISPLIKAENISLNGSFTWESTFSFNNDINVKLKNLFLRIGDKNLGSFLNSFYRPRQERCEEFTQKVIIRKYKDFHEENIISLEKLKHLKTFSDLDYSFDRTTSSIYINEEFSKFINGRLDLVEHLG